MPPVIDEKKCIGCTTCAQICCTDVFGPAEENQIVQVRYPDECWHCRACIMDCPTGAIDLRYPLQYLLQTAKVSKNNWEGLE